MATDHYEAPSWAQAPALGDGVWTLTEIKNGAEVAQHVLDKACATLGRAADRVDIELAHESCSRRHARIAFDSRGVPWLRDLASTHGTTVNKKALPAAATGKRESASTKEGARGVVLFPGDILQFGASTRLFCLEGPSSFERGAMKAIQQQRQQDQSQSQPTGPGAEPQPFDDRESTEAEETPKTLDDDSIPQQHQKAWEALKAKRYKQHNLETENQRIEAKGELSSGQERQLERNRQRLVSLQEDIDEMEKDLLNKIYPGAAKGGGGPSRLFNAAEVEDDVDDRTEDESSRLRHEHSNEAETEETLIIRWKKDHNEYVKLNESIDVAENRACALQNKVNAATDGEDAFFLQNELDLAQDVRHKAKRRREEVFARMKDSQKLLRIVNNKIIADVRTGYIGSEPDMPPPNASQMMPPPPPFSSMPPPAVAVRSKKIPSPSLSQSSVLMPPPAPQSKRSMPPPTAPSSASTNNNANNNPTVMKDVEPPKAKRSRAVGPVMMPPPGASGTLSFLNLPVASEANDERKIETAGGGPALVLDVDATKKDVWVAPKGQDGSGRTKLNEKFAGRY